MYVNDDTRPTAIGYQSEASDLNEIHVHYMCPPPTPPSMGSECHNLGRRHVGINNNTFTLSPTTVKVQRKILEFYTFSQNNYIYSFGPLYWKGVDFKFNQHLQVNMMNFYYQLLYKHVYKCVYFKILTQTRGAGISHLQKGVNFLHPFRHFFSFGKGGGLLTTGIMRGVRWIFCKLRCSRTDWQMERIAK